MSVIKVENLSKSYRLGVIGAKTLRDDLSRWWAKLRRRPDPLLKIGQSPPSPQVGEGGRGVRGAPPSSSDDRIWALRDVSFEVQQGEVLGIIGRNGAGKSTLLKILSRVTAPTSGAVKVKGRIASLLEVGTGFHPELTGRENIYLNGAILGMKRLEIDRKFAEIVDFSGVEKFIDTPVKRYSSGMYVRLAFAVAAHLEPEILVVDEVLAVGDAEFQKKCLGKMGEVAQGGRTVLFVSHNMAAVQSLCDAAIVLSSGVISFQGAVSLAIHTYNQILFQGDIPRANSSVTINSLILKHPTGQVSFSSTDTLVVQINFVTNIQLANCYMNFVVKDGNGQLIIHTRNDFVGLSNLVFEPGNHNLQITIPRLSLKAGIYSIIFSIYVNSIDTFIYLESEPHVLEVIGRQEGGIMDIPCEWKFGKYEY